MNEVRKSHDRDEPVAASDPVREFAERLIDDLRIGEEVGERDAADTGERVTLEDLARSVGIAPESLSCEGNDSDES